MHIDDTIKANAEVIDRAQRGESLTGDDRIVKATGTIIRAYATKIEYSVRRGERPEIEALNSRDPVTAAASTLAQAGARKRAA